MMQPVWVRRESVRAWRTNIGAGRTANDAMMVCDDVVGLYLPIEVWMVVCEWLVATRALTLMLDQFDGIAKKVATYDWWMEKFTDTANNLFNTVDPNPRETYLAALIHTRSRAITLSFRIKYLIAESALWCRRLGHGETHLAAIDGLSFEA